MCFRSIFRHEKKVLALVLAFACAFTMFAGAAFTDQADINADNVDAVDLLTTLKIIKGYEDGSFDPEGTVDRAEMAKMIYTIRNGGNDNASAHVGNTTSFTDISGHWAEGYIKYLQNTGIVAGKSATQFAPDAQVTTAEAMKMALALAGYDEKNAGLTGIDWQKNTLTYATTIGLTDNVASAMSAGCTRQDAAQILANCLGATAVRYSAVVENFVNDSKEGLSFGGPAISVGNKWMDLYTNIGTLIGIDGDALTITMTQSDEADSDAPSIKEFIDLDTDYSELLGQKVKVLFEGGKNNSVIGVYATVDNTVYTVEANDTSKDEEKVAFGGNSYRLDDEGGITTYIDGDKNAQWTSLDELDHNTLNPNMYTFVDTDDNGRLDTLVVRTYDVAKVSYVASDRVIAAGQTYKYDDEIIADGIEKDDWVVITHDMYNDCWNIEPVEVQSADLVGMRDDKNGDMYFDGNEKYIEDVNYDEYQVGDNWYAGGDDAVQSARSENDLKNVKAVQAVDYVAVNGIMFYIERSSGTNNGRVDNVAVVLAETGHNAVAEQARIAFFNGDTKVVDIEDKSVDIEVGEAYEYTVIGDEYRFSELKAGIEGRNDKWEDYEEYYGDLSFRGDVNANIDELNGDHFDRVKIDDNAQVLLYWAKDGADADWDVVSITGKKFNDIPHVDNLLNGKGVVAGEAAYGFSGDMGGLNRIGALALQVAEDLDLSKIGIPTWNHYGYILTNAKWVNRNNGIAEYQLFTDGYIYNVQEEIDDLNERRKNTVLGYDELTGDGVVVRAVVENVEEGTYGIEGAVVLDRNDGGLVFSAITTVSDDGNTVIMSNGYEMDISDATIIYVDSKNGAAITDGDVKVALKNYDLDGDPYMANALFIGENNGDCELLVVDQGRYLESDYYDDTIGVSGTDANTVYGKDTANDGADEDVMDYVSVSSTRVNGDGDLIFNMTIDQPAWATDNAKYTVEYKVYGDGKLVDTYEKTALAAGSQKITNNTADFGVYDEVTVELVDGSLKASNVKVLYFVGNDELEIGKDLVNGTSDTVASTGAGNQIFVQAQDWLDGVINAKYDFKITGTVGTDQKGTVALTNANGTSIAGVTLGDAVVADGTGYVTVTFTKVSDDGAKYTFTGLNGVALNTFNGVDESETATLTIAPATQMVNGGTSLNLTAKLDKAPTAADEYVVTVKVGNQTLSWTLDDGTVPAPKALTINGDVKLDATNVTVKAVDKPEIAKDEASGSKPVIELDQENGKYVYVIDFDMNIELVDSSKISATAKTGEDANIVNSVRVENNKLYVILNGTMDDGATISVDDGAVCDADDSSNANDAQTLVYSSATNSWGFQA